MLTDKTTKLPHLESRWVNILWQFLQTVEGTIEVDNEYIPPLQQQNDCYLMGLALASTPTLPPPCDIHRTINYCRLYLNVVTFSDKINTADTPHIDAGIYQGSPVLGV